MRRFPSMASSGGSDWTPVEVRFAHRRPLDEMPYKHFFHVPLRWDTEQYAVVFSVAWMNRRLPDTSAELLQLLQREIDKLATQQEENFSEQVRSLLRTSLMTGHSSADQIAEIFSMHRRTLNRRLNESGTSFRELSDEIRCEIARQLLEDSAMEIIDIASLLGYSNASAFTRAFRRWCSETPAKWRAKARREAPDVGVRG